MTTIVYNHLSREIGIDSRKTARNGSIKNDADKKWMQDNQGGFWFLCGSVADTDRFIEYMLAKDPEPPKYRIDVGALYVKDGLVFRCGITTDGEPFRSPVDHNEGSGSGGDWALAALDFGLSTKESVAYAISKDCFSGGLIRVFDIGTMEFING
jgi:hypothetical protein